MLADWMQKNEVPARDVVVNIAARSPRASAMLLSAVMKDNVFSASATGKDMRDFVLSGVRIKLT